jgi:hypothetical protein
MRFLSEKLKTFWQSVLSAAYKAGPAQGHSRCLTTVPTPHFLAPEGSLVGQGSQDNPPLNRAQPTFPIEAREHAFSALGVNPAATVQLCGCGDSPSMKKPGCVPIKLFTK